MNAVRQPGRLHRFALGAAVAAVALAPLAAGLPAEASTSAHGCTVRPIKPVARTTALGAKVVDYEVLATCAGNRTIQVQQYFMEDDLAPDTDDVVGSALVGRSFANPAAAQVTTTRPAPNTELGREEIYQKARFRVSIGGAPFSSWTTFEPTGTISVAS